MERANIAIIPARGGSKRIPRKNIRNFCGKPLIAHSITAALQSDLFKHVIVSTDDYEIATIAKAAGASVPFMRSAETANDFATTVDVLNEVVNRLYTLEKLDYAALCCIYPTAPLLTAETLIASHAVFAQSKGETLMPLVRYGHPIQRSLEIVDSRARYIWPENISARTQDLSPRFHDCGQFYWIGWRGLREHKKLNMDAIIPFEIDETFVQDIDSESDWQLAELKFQALKGQ